MHPSELSSALRTKHDEWWAAYVNKDLKKAAYLSNDIEVISRALAAETHRLLEEKVSADFETRHRADQGAGAPTTNRGGR